jgi:hypothetical protein
MIIGHCAEGCSSEKFQSFNYKIYKNIGMSQEWIEVLDIEMFTFGSKSNELTIRNELFKEEYIPNIQANYWKIELQINMLDTNKYGSSSIIIKENELPTNGTCSLSPEIGYAMETIFTINCHNWIDPDGTVMKYEFFGYYLIKKAFFL